MEGDLFRLYLTILDFDLVPGKDDGDIFTYAGKIAMPIGDIFVCNARGDIEHDDGTLALDVIPITQSTEFLLSGSIPHVEFNGPAIGMEEEGMDFDSECRDIFLFELSRQVPFDEGGFADSSVTDEDELEFWYILVRLEIMIGCELRMMTCEQMKALR